MKMLFKRLALLVLSFVLSLALLEGLLTALVWWKYDTVDVAQLEQIQSGNRDAAELTTEGDRSVTDYRLMAEAVGMHFAEHLKVPTAPNSNAN